MEFIKNLRTLSRYNVDKSFKRKYIRSFLKYYGFLWFTFILLSPYIILIFILSKISEIAEFLIENVNLVRFFGMNKLHDKLYDNYFNIVRECKDKVNGKKAKLVKK